MLFDYDLTVPSATPQTSPVLLQARLTRGILREIRVSFPPGCATLVHTRIQHNLLCLLPANPDGDLNFDDTIIFSKMSYGLVSPPYEISIYAWAPSTTFDHTLTLQFELNPLPQITWQEFLTELAAQFSSPPGP